MIILILVAGNQLNVSGKLLLQFNFLSFFLFKKKYSLVFKKLFFKLRIFPRKKPIKDLIVGQSERPLKDLFPNFSKKLF